MPSCRPSDGVASSTHSLRKRGGLTKEPRREWPNPYDVSKSEREFAKRPISYFFAKTRTRVGLRKRREVILNKIP